jgi:2'-5' RNA ligase
VWQPTELALVESHLGQGRGHRPRYEVVAAAPLA